MKTNSETTLRLFIAINMPEEVIQEAQRIQNHFKEENLFKGTFTEPAGLHLTLKFLGTVSPKRLDDLKQRLQSVAIRQLPANLGPVDFFMSGPDLKVLFLHIVCPQMTDLVKAIDNALGSGFRSENRAFIGHITLARIKSIDDQAREQLVYEVNAIRAAVVEFTINSFVLKQSLLSPDGSTYIDLARYQLLT